jgi:hypothetical protein
MTTTTTSQSNPAQNNKRQTPSAACTMEPLHDCVGYFREYSRERPDVVALWCLGIGFILGWKLKPW